VGVSRQERATPLPTTLSNDSVRSVKAPDNPFAEQLAQHAAQLGLAALQGELGYARDSLVYSAAVTLHARQVASSMSEAAEMVRGVLDDGRALARFEAAARAND
jgi:anthranilate phosphoribosyltransferase